MKKYTINDKYFENIDNERKAYWLGLLWADGSINKSSKACKTPNRLQISQNKDNKDVLYEFVKDLNSNYPVLHTMKPSGYNSKGEFYELRINNTKIVSDLMNKGFDRKDRRIKLPKIKPNLMNHFIRGYFDGDGCLSLYDQKRGHYITKRHELSFTGYTEFIKELQNVLEINTKVTKNVKLKTYKRTLKSSSLRYGGKQSIDEIYNYMYKDATIYNKNKHNKFITLYS